MFVLTDLINDSTAEYNDIKDMLNTINSIWLNNDEELSRLSEIVGRMKFGEIYECLRYRIRCVDDSLVTKKIFLGCSNVPEGFYIADTVNKAKNAICHMKSIGCQVEFISIGDEIPFARRADGGTISDFFEWCRDNHIYISYAFSNGYGGYELVRTGTIAYPRKKNNPDAMYYAKTADGMSLAYTGEIQEWTIYCNGTKQTSISSDFCCVVDNLNALNRS